MRAKTHRRCIRSLGVLLCVLQVLCILVQSGVALLCSLGCCCHAPVMAQQLAASRPLLAGLPARGQALKRQRANLLAFANDPANAEAFAAMPYEKWTTVPADADGANGFQFESRASTLLPGLRGVFPRQPVPASSREVRLLAYHGLLVTHALYQSFYEKFYCPTGLELPALQFRGADGRSVGMVLIGDPTAMAALINDGRYGRKNGQSKQCCESALQQQTRSLLTLPIVAALRCVSRLSVRFCLELLP